MASLILPNGSSIQLNLMKSALGEDTIIDIRELKTKAGVIFYDPGLSSTAICDSGITYIDGDAGLCMYRGFPIHEMADKMDYLDICHLLLYGHFPSEKESQTIKERVNNQMIIPEFIKGIFKGFKQDAHPMSMLSSIASSLSGIYPNPMEMEINSKEEKDNACINSIGKMVTIGAMVYKFSIGEPFIYPKSDYSYSENLLHMMFSHPSKPYVVNKLHAQFVNTFLNLHADHEQAASTCTVRTTGSSGASPYSCLGAAISSLGGRAHGGANEAVLRMLAEIGSEENIPSFIEQVKQKKRRLMGFGHRVYKNRDPRCNSMRKLCLQLFEESGSSDPLFDLAMALEKVALSDEYFTKRKLYPNVDFYSGISLRALGVPNNMFTVFFAIGRTCGWMSHWKEMVEDVPIKIARPRQLYIGPQRENYFENENGVLMSKQNVNGAKTHYPSTSVFFDYEFDIWGESST